MSVRVSSPTFPVRAAAVLLGIGTVALLVRSYDAPLALVPLALAAACVPLLLRPELAVYVSLFLLYVNLPAIAHQFYGVPGAFGAAIILLLGLPLVGIMAVRREPVRTGAVFHLMLAFFAVLLLSALFAPELGIAFGRILSFVTEGLLLYWLVVNAVRTESVLRRALWTVVLAGSLAGGLSLYQAATGAHDSPFGGFAQRDSRLEFVPSRQPGEKPQLQVIISDRSAGPIGEPNRYAQILLVLVPIAAVFVRRARSRTGFAAAAVCLALLLAGVLLSQSRAALLTLALLILAGLYLRWVRPAHLVIAGTLILLLSLRFAPGLAQRMASLAGAADLVREQPTMDADAAIRGRATEMLAALHAFMDHPLLGVGPGQYFAVYSVEYQQNLPTKYRDLQTPRRAHNLYLEIAAETGILGLLCFLWIMVTLARQLRWARKYWAERDPERADLATGFLLALGAYLLTGLFLHLAFERYLWLLLGLAGAAMHTVWTDRQAAPEYDEPLWAEPVGGWPLVTTAVPPSTRALRAARLGDEH